MTVAIKPDEAAADAAQAAKAAIHDSIERARELLCEAKLVIGEEEELLAPAPVPPNPAT